MPKLSNYLKEYKLHVILGPLFKLLEAVFEVITPLVMADIIDNGIIGPNASIKYILIRCAIMFGLAIIGLCCSLTCQYFAARCSQGVGTKLRSDVFTHTLQLSSDQRDKIGSSSLTTRLNNDINQVQTAIAMVIRLATRAPFLIIGATIVAIIINPTLSGVFLVTTPLIIFAGLMIMRYALPQFKKAQSKLDKITLIARENLTGTRVVRAFNKEADDKEKFSNANDDFTKIVVRASKVVALLNPVFNLILYFGVIAILYFGGVQVNTGNMSQGEIVAFISYITQISTALVVLANLVMMITRASASNKRVFEVLELQSSIEDKEENVTFDENADAIDFDNVCFDYDNDDINVLDNITFHLKQGKSLGIIGGTGSGKSTIVKLIPRIIDSKSGTINILGQNIKDIPLKQLRSKIGYVPQKATLFNLTIRENIKLGKADATDEEINAALKVADAYNFVYEKEGLDTKITELGNNLSGGQKQRLTIARAIINDPKILLLDDSSSALDMATDLKVRRAINKHCTNCATIIVSQRISAVRHCDNIMVIENGKCVGYGKHKDLLTNNNVYKEICMSQGVE